LLNRIDVHDLISRLGLEPHPEEGGYFTETYRSSLRAPREALPTQYGDSRAFSTAIYYLLTPDTVSAMHRVKSDEIFHFYLGDPVEQLQLSPDDTGKIVTIGADLLSGQRPQVIVPAGVWQGAHLAAGGQFALFGCTVSPGFEYADYQHGDREQLITQYPAFRELITLLSR
jgi:uncharacterized protein